jgi:hypothetical protein
MAGGRLGMIGGSGGTIVVAPPPDPDPDPTPSGWASPLQYDAPAGWENYAELIVPASSGVDKNADVGEWGVHNISLQAGQDRKIVMPMPGDAYGNTTCRKGKLKIQGGGNLVFCVKFGGTTTRYRRGGFSMMMPKYSPWPATTTTSPPSSERKVLDLIDNNAVNDGRIIDIVGLMTHGVDNAEGIVMNGDKTHFQLQRSRIWAGRYRCAADRSGQNTKVNDGYSASTNNPYRLQAENTHCDCIQCYGEGWKSIRIHDTTFLSGMGVFSFFNLQDWKGVDVIMDTMYLSRFNIEPFYFSTPETLNNFNTGYNNQGRNQGTRWYMGITDDGGKMPINRIFVDDDVYFGRNNSWNPNNGDPAWPGRDMATLMNTTGGFTVFDSASDTPRRVEFSKLSTFDSQLTIRRWNRTAGGGPNGTFFTTAGQFRIGDPPGGSYAPASMWGGDGLSYIE